MRSEKYRNTHDVRVVMCAETNVETKYLDGYFRVANNYILSCMSTQTVMLSYMLVM